MTLLDSEKVKATAFSLKFKLFVNLTDFAKKLFNFFIFVKYFTIGIVANESKSSVAKFHYFHRSAICL